MAGSTNTTVIGVDVGGTKVLAAAFDPTEPESVLARGRVDTPTGADALVTAILDAVDLVDQPAGTPVGVGVAGLVDREGRLRVGPNLPGIVDAPIQSLLSATLDGPVEVVNDASAAALAEFRLGAGRGAHQLVVVTLGTGIGGALVLDGRLFLGGAGFAGEVGHMVVDADGPPCPCGRRGCWERYASGYGLGRLGRDAALAGRLAVAVDRAGGDPEAVRGEHVTAAAEQGDPGALAVIDQFSWWLALGLSNLAAVVDPDRIVVGGGVVEAYDLFIEPTRRHFADLLMEADHRPMIAVEPATLGSAAGAIGAGLLVAGTS